MNDAPPHAGDDATNGPPPSVTEMIGRRVTVTLDGAERSATVVDSGYARNTGNVLIAVELDAASYGETDDATNDATGDATTAERDGGTAGRAAGERIVVEEDRVRFE